MGRGNKIIDKSMVKTIFEDNILILLPKYEDPFTSNWDPRNWGIPKSYLERKIDFKLLNILLSVYWLWLKHIFFYSCSTNNVYGKEYSLAMKQGCLL